MPKALAQPTARQVAAHFLAEIVDLNTRCPDHTGCLGVNGALAGSEDAEPVRQALLAFRAAGVERLRERFEKAKAEGDLLHDADPGVLATFVAMIAHGIAVQAKAGLDQALLRAAAAQALASWPGR